MSRSPKQTSQRYERLARKESEHVPLKAEVAEEIFDSIVRLGALQPLMDDDSISNIMVNQGGNQIFPLTAMVASDFSTTVSRGTQRIIDRIAATANQHVDEASPCSTAPAENGSRVNITIPQFPWMATLSPSVNFPEPFPHQQLDLKQNHVHPNS